MNNNQTKELPEETKQKLDEIVGGMVIDALKKQRQEFRKVVEEVEKVNESNGRYNACQEILKAIE